MHGDDRHAQTATTAEKLDAARHEDIRRQIDLEVNARSGVILPFGAWRRDTDSILFLVDYME